MRYLAFDLGASSGKMFAGDFDGEKLALHKVHGFENRAIDMGGHLYWDFPGIYRNLCDGISIAARESDVASLGIDSFNNDFSFVDKAGALLQPLRAYRDERALRHEEAIYRRIPKEKLYMLSGNQLAPFNTYMQLAAMVEDGHGYIFDKADNLLMLPDLAAYFLTGERVMEYTLAAETQMLDLETRSWIPEALDAIPFPKRLFAPLVQPGSSAGRVKNAMCRDLGVRSFDVVSVCEHDTASAFLAAPIRRDCAIISSGTWAIVGVETERPVVEQYGYLHNIANEGGPDGHHRLLKNVMGSWILQELIRDFALGGQRFDYGDTQALARAAKPFHCMIDADDVSFYEPGDMRRKIRDASLKAVGRAPESPGEYFRTVYEALSFKYRQALEEIETLTGRAYTQVSLIGGGAQDELACQFAANALERPLTAGPVDGSALGNVLVQMIAGGEIASVGEGRQVILRSCAYREYSPADQALWREQYMRYGEIFHRA